MKKKVSKGKKKSDSGKEKREKKNLHCAKDSHLKDITLAETSNCD